MKTFKHSYIVHAPVEKVWDALVNPEAIEEWSGAPAKMAPKTGFQFSLWSDDVHGTNTEVEEHERLVQDWYGGKWKQPSKLTIILTPENEETKLDLLHEDIPDDEYEGVFRGWEEYYMGPLKEYLEGEM